MTRSKGLAGRVFPERDLPSATETSARQLGEP